MLLNSPQMFGRGLQCISGPAQDMGADVSHGMSFFLLMKCQDLAVKNAL